MNHNVATIAAALAWATEHLKATSNTARLDAELLLAHVLNRSRSYILAESSEQLSTAQQKAFCNLIARRANLEPVAYLIGHKEFYGLDFSVTPVVLVPRPETELLVELTLAFARRFHAQSPLLIADIGTGSGIIAIVLAMYLPQAFIYAVDISQDALEVARQNAAQHLVSRRIQFVAGDLLTSLKEPVNLIVSNPPYTVLAEIDENVRRHEPHQALDGGSDGLDVYRRLLAQSPGKLRPGGAVLVEIGATQGTAVTALARAHFPTAQVRIYKDLAGLDRVVVIAPHIED